MEWEGVGREEVGVHEPGGAVSYRRVWGEGRVLFYRTESQDLSLGYYVTAICTQPGELTLYTLQETA